MRDLTGKVAVITGGAAGIGKALALECARAGMDVVIADLDGEGGRAVTDEVTALGRRSLYVPTDVRDPGSLEILLARTLSELGGCHVMFNNAGVFHAASLVDTSAEQYQRVIGINIGGVVAGCRVFGNHFVKQGEGHIVNTASAAGLFPAPGMSAYSLTKYAVVGFSLQLRWELSSLGIGVTVLCPGTVKTAITLRDGVGLKPVEAEKLTARAPSPEGLARKALRAIRRDKPMVRYGPDAFTMSIFRVLPLWLIDPLGKLIGRTALGVLKTTTIGPGAATKVGDTQVGDAQVGEKQS